MLCLSESVSCQKLLCPSKVFHFNQKVRYFSQNMCYVSPRVYVRKYAILKSVSCKSESVSCYKVYHALPGLLGHLHQYEEIVILVLVPHSLSVKGGE